MSLARRLAPTPTTASFAAASLRADRSTSSAAASLRADRSTTPAACRRARGFTLVELMVVVVMVAIMAVLAVPQVAERLRERRSSEAAQRIASLYRSGRLRALGRGSAVLVRYDTNGFRVYEAVQGTSAESGCQKLPSSSCLATDWNEASERHEVTSFAPAQRGEYEGVAASVSDPGGTVREALDICYTPVGRAYLRTSSVSAFDPMMGVATVAVNRGTGSLTRRVTLMPNGIARLAL